MTITIPYLPPSLNEYIRMHYHARHDLLTQWTGYVMAYSAGLERLPAGRKLVTITLTYASKRYVRDLDGAYGGCKPLIDALRYRGLIKDDNPLEIELRLKQVVGTAKQTIVEIEALS